MLGTAASAMSDEERAQRRAYSKEAWNDGWPARIIDFAKQQGFRTLAQLLAARPGMPYLELKSVFPFPVVPIQIVRLQLIEATNESRIRDAARDVLVRALNREFPNGWQNGEGDDFRRDSAFSDFVTHIRLDAKSPELADGARRVCTELQKASPPQGWHPNNTDDPLIQQSFAVGWPG